MQMTFSSCIQPHLSKLGFTGYSDLQDLMGVYHAGLIAKSKVVFCFFSNFGCTIETLNINCYFDTSILLKELEKWICSTLFESIKITHLAAFE